MTTKEQRIQEARLRMISRQRKEDEDVQNMFGLPIDREELTVDLTTLLGFAYITQPSDHWVYEVGSFPYLRGLFSGVANTLDRDDDHDSFNHAFFVLDAHLKPIKVISLFLVPKELTASIGKPKYNVILRDLIGTTNPDVERFEFMI